MFFVRLFTLKISGDYQHAFSLRAVFIEGLCVMASVHVCVCVCVYVTVSVRVS